MASIRQLKKDVDYLTFAVIDDCFTYAALSERNEEQVVKLIESTVLFRNEMRNRINTRQKFADSKERKAYYKGLAIDLMKVVDEKFTQLSELAKEK